MYLMYVDESGDTGLLSSPTNFFALSGIVVHESDWREFLQALIEMRKTYRATYCLPLREEIHAAPYIRRPGKIPKHIRLAILRNSIDELAKLPISITSVIVDKRTKRAPYDVFNTAWNTLFQRFENTLKNGNFPGGYRADHGLVVTDDTGGKRLTRLVRKMAVHNPIPNNVAHGPGHRNIPIQRIIEDPHARDSADALPIQMADVVAYFLHQRFAPNSYIRKQRATHYYDRLLPVLNLKASRTNALGIVEI